MTKDYGSAIVSVLTVVTERVALVARGEDS